MAEWYCGTVQHAAIAQWAATHAYSVGDIVRDLAAVSDDNARAFRCTTAGTSGAAEPAWNRGKAANTTSGGATFQEATGNSSWGWNAAHKTLRRALDSGWIAAGDTIYVASNHDYLTSAAYTIAMNGSASLATIVLSVNAAGSVPPVAADLLAGAKETTTGGSALTINHPCYIYGVTFVSGSGSAATVNTTIGSSPQPGPQTYDNCTFVLASTGGGSRIIVDDGGDNNTCHSYFWNNVTVKFAAIGQAIACNQARLTWKGGSVDGAGSIPTNLLANAANIVGNFIQMIGLDLSALGSNTIIAGNNASDVYQLINCRVGTTYSLVGSITSLRSCVVDFIISDNTTKNYNHERHIAEGDLVTETTNVRASGANDGVTAFSWKVTTSSRAIFAYPFECFTRTIWNDATGSSKTLTIELLNSATTLTNKDIFVEVEYLNSASYPTAGFATSAPANILSTASNLATSSEIWDTTGVSSPVQQKLTVSFTPQMKGYIRYTVKVAKPSKTIWIDPKAAIS